MKIAQNLTEIIGNTPMVKLNKTSNPILVLNAGLLTPVIGALRRLVHIMPIRTSPDRTPKMDFYTGYSVHSKNSKR